MNKHLLVALLTLMALPLQSWAQGRSIPKGSEAKAKEVAEELFDELPEGQTHRYPLINGLNVSVDVFDPLLKLTIMNHASYEVQAMLDIHHRFFPMFTYGIGRADERSNNGLDFNTDEKQEFDFVSGPASFAKVGLAYNLDYNSTKPNDFYMLLLRYGIAHNEADITNLYYADKLWGGIGPIDIKNQKYTTHWLEVGGMIKVQLMRHVSMGWDLYWKFKLAQSGTRQGEPYYVPGMGTSDSPLGFSLRVYYDIF